MTPRRDPGGRARADEPPRGCSVGRLADVVADLAQRPVGLRHHRRGDLEDVHLAGPHPQLDGYSGRGQPPRGQPSVVQQHLGTRHMDQRGGQAGLDVVERLIDFLGVPIHDVTLGRLDNQVDEGVKRLGREHRIAADVGVRLLGDLGDLHQR